MSKAKKEYEAHKKETDQRMRLLGVLSAAVLIVIVAMSAMYMSNNTETSGSTTGGREAALASDHSPSLGNPDAKVHIVEFLDPACETCALYFPLVKNWMDEAPDKLRLSVRHVAFHSGSDYAVKVLEASRKQDKYWETLEALLSSQRRWTSNHTVLPERIAPAIAAVGLDMDKLMADMNGVDILAHIEQDKKDSIELRVSATPTYFVNGRPLPSFGAQQLMDLVSEELRKAD